MDDKAAHLLQQGSKSIAALIKEHAQETAGKSCQNNRKRPNNERDTDMRSHLFSMESMFE